MNIQILAASLVEGMQEVNVRFEGCTKKYAYLAHLETLGRELKNNDYVIVQTRDTIKPAVVCGNPKDILDINRSINLRYVVSLLPKPGDQLPIEAHVDSVADKLLERQSQQSKKQAMAALGLSESDVKFLAGG